jgi:hypothetical protein
VIAISYRREDSKPVAGRIYDRLQAEFGKGNVFMDFDSIPYGVDFREHIQQTLQKAKVLVAIIGPDWMGERSKLSRRIEEPTDFVRLEIAAALQHGIPIIPVLVDKTPMPNAKLLPREIKDLTFRNGLDLDTGIDFHHHTDRLVSGIRRALSVPEEAPRAVGKKPAARESQPRKNVLALGLLAASVLTAASAFYFWRYSTEPAIRAPAVAPVPALPPEIVPEKRSEPVVTESTKVPLPGVELSVSPPPMASAPASAEEAELPATGEENTYSGQVGSTRATFRLRFQQGGRVTGTYTQKGRTFRLEGENPTGKLLLEEYTGDQLTARIELVRKSSGAHIQWEGTMYNTPPDNRVFPVSFSRSRK